MKIIHKGELPDQTLVGTCSHCKCVIECDRSEAKWEDGDRPTDHGNHYYPCPTPQCGRSIYLKPKTRPEYDVK